MQRYSHGAQLVHRCRQDRRFAVLTGSTDISKKNSNSHCTVPNQILSTACVKKKPAFVKNRMFYLEKKYAKDDIPKITKPKLGRLLL